MPNTTRSGKTFRCPRHFHSRSHSCITQSSTMVISDIIWFMVKPQVLQRKYSLLHTAIPEHAELARLNNTYPRYHDVAAKVLLLVGKEVEPSSPGFASNKLSSVLQDVTYTQFPKLDHLAPEKSPKEVARAVAEFFRSRDV